VVLRLASCDRSAESRGVSLVNKDGMPELARRIFDDLRKHYNTFYDDGGSIGSALPPPGRGRYAVRHHHRRPVDAKTNGDGARPGHLETGSSWRPTNCRRYLAQKLRGSALRRLPVPGRSPRSRRCHPSSATELYRRTEPVQANRSSMTKRRSCSSRESCCSARSSAASWPPPGAAVSRDDPPAISRCWSSAGRERRSGSVSSCGAVIPVLAYGSHVQVELLRAAREAGRRRCRIPSGKRLRDLLNT